MESTVPAQGLLFDRQIAPGRGDRLTGASAMIFAELRRRNFQTHVVAATSFGDMTGRNQDAVKKTAAGLLKLLHPHLIPDQVPGPLIAAALDIAVEMRRRVIDQLAKMQPTEFTGARFEYRVNGE